MNKDLFYYFPADKNYRETYENVGGAVEAGGFSSGYDHYKKFGKSEGKIYKTSSLYLSVAAVVVAVAYGIYKLLGKKRRVRR